MTALQYDTTNPFIHQEFPLSSAHPPIVPVPVRDTIIRIPTRHNIRLQQIIDRVNQDAELATFWRCANINAVDRLGMSDHGPVHVQIVANLSLKLLRLLLQVGLTFGVVGGFQGG